jgi:hypothetical protein
MAEFRQFKRSRLERKSEEKVTKKTVSLGIITIIVFILVIIFGLPLLVKLSIFLGEIKNKKEKVVVEKVLPPLAPRLILPFDATNSATISITGVADPKTSVELLKNDSSLAKKDVTDAGDFVFDNVSLDKGNNVFTAISINDKGVNSEISKQLKVIFDDTPPEITMINPSEDTLTVDNPDFDIVGKSEKGVSVLINGHVAMVDDNGQFKLKLQLNSGKNDVEIDVTDQAGNVTKKNISITY